MFDTLEHPMSTKDVHSTPAPYKPTAADVQWAKDHAPVDAAALNIHADSHAHYMASAH